MIKLLLLLFFFLPGETEEKNDNLFEGQINLVKESHYDVSYYKYFVKEKNIRIEEFDNAENLKYILFVDLEKKRTIALNPDMKAYKILNKDIYQGQVNDDFEVIKTNYRKEINGYVCYQWRVRNTTMNSEISYWVTNESFDFYDDFLKVMNKTENNYFFFLQIPGSDGYMPIQSVERTLVRKEKMKFTVSEISTRKLENSLFEIPEDYNMVQN